MTGCIRVLDRALADQIAAGEVVERPASVVKELVENALDAGAGNVTVECEGGGVVLVRVTDDGVGMSSSDAELCVQRHATSKLASKEELGAIRTLGFRGEALPSIASVCRFTLRSRTKSAVAGTEVRIDGGDPPSVREAGCAPGTSVEVRDLFYNVPARRKFLKKKGTESAHITDVCLRVALGFPKMRLVLLRDGRRVLELLPDHDMFARAARVLAETDLSSIAWEREGIKLSAALGPPERARSGAAGLYLLVNQRPVRSPALARAVAFAYGSVLPRGRYPAGVVQLELDPHDIDVNVHPQKAEVRFARAQAVLEAITRGLAKELGTQPWSGPSFRSPDYWSGRLASRKHDASQPASASRAPGLRWDDRKDPRSGPDRAANGEPARVGPSSFEPSPGEPGPGEPSPGKPSPGEPGPGEPGPAAAGATGIPDQPDPWGLFPGYPGREAAPQPSAVRSPSAGSLLPEPGLFGSLRAVGQVRRMFILCEGRHALYILDQHAADERVRFHSIKNDYQQRSVKRQQLLFPERIECLATHIQLVDEQPEALERMGLECSVIGATTVAVRSVPALMGRVSPARLVRDVLDQLARSGERAFSDSVDKALATMACHGAIRGGDSLSRQECQALLANLDQVDDFAGYCPHGRPIVFKIAFDELEHRLGR